MIRPLIACVALAGVVAPASADAPLEPAPAITCSANGRACATRDRDGHAVTVWRRGRGGARVGAWRTSIASPRVVVADDGRSLVELYPGLNLLNLDATGDTIVLVFHRPDARPVPVTLRAVAPDVARLPRTVSHRQWARAYGYDGPGSFLLLTPDGRSLRFDPATGRSR